MLTSPPRTLVLLKTSTQQPPQATFGERDRGLSSIFKKWLGRLSIFLPSFLLGCGLLTSHVKAQSFPKLIRNQVLENSFQEEIENQAATKKTDLLSAANNSPFSQQEAHPTLWIRMAWGGGAAAKWSGKIKLSEGKLQDLKLLGMDGSSPGSIWIENNEVLIASKSAHGFDGVDLQITGPLTAQLQIILTDQLTGESKKLTLVLKDLIEKYHREKLDTHGNMLLVHRSPGDELQVRTTAKSLIFEPLTVFEFEVQPTLSKIKPGTSLDVVIELRKARQTETIWTFSKRLPMPIVGDPLTQLSIPLPGEEGVYEVRIETRLPTGFTERFVPGAKGKLLATRSFQLTVFANNPPPKPIYPASTEEVVLENRWQQVTEIDPTKPGWQERLPSWMQNSRLPGASNQPIQHGQIETVRKENDDLIMLGLPTKGEPAWHAFRLPMVTPGKPYQIEIDYPAGTPMRLGCSLLEPNSEGRVTPRGRDFGFYVDTKDSTKQNQIETYRFTFWPKSSSPLLLITNLSKQTVGYIGKIRLLESTKPRLSNQAKLQNKKIPARLVAAYCASPLLSELFGATDKLDLASGHSVDDTETFYEASIRLADYLNYAGYNSALVSVYADGSTIYPSRYLDPTPKHDTRRLAYADYDLAKHDSLEMMMKIFQRENLQFIPTLDFSTPLPEIERKISQATTREAKQAYQWINGRGESWLERYGPQRAGKAPYYNLLNPEVQQCVINVIEEILQQYDHHPNFRGIALQLSPGGFLVLPNPEWGMDDQTLKQFSKDSKIQVPGTGPDAGPNRFNIRANFLLTKHRTAWIQWRAEKLTKFYERLEFIVQKSNENRLLILTTEKISLSAQAKHVFRPSLSAQPTKVKNWLLSWGLDIVKLNKIKNLVLLRPRHISPSTPLAKQATDLQINQTKTLGRMLSGSHNYGELLFIPSHQTRVQSFDTQSPFGSEKTFTFLNSQTSPAGVLARKRFIQSLSYHDPNILVAGGEMISIDHDNSTRHLLRQIGQLPGTTAIEKTETYRQQPILVRAYHLTNGESVCCVINQSAWQVAAQLTCKVNNRTKMQIVSMDSAEKNKQPERSLSQGQHALPITLKPYSMQIMRFVGTKITILGIQVEIPIEVKKQLLAKLENLTDRNLSVQREMDSLENPSFEPLVLKLENKNGLVGWRKLLPDKTENRIELERVGAHDGLSSVRLINRDGTYCSLISKPFLAPETGQFAVTIYAKKNHLSANSRLLLIIEDMVSGREYQKIATLCKGTPNPQKNSDTEWNWYVFAVDDLPLIMRNKIQLRFELRGKGDVSLDQVRLYDLLFPLDFYKPGQRQRLELLKQVYAARNAYNNGRWIDCERILDGYWARFVIAHTPRNQTPQQIALLKKPETKKPETKKAAPQESKTIGNRIKGYLPKIFR